MRLGYHKIRVTQSTLKNTSKLQSQVRRGNGRSQNIAHKLSQYNLGYECFGITQSLMTHITCTLNVFCCCAFLLVQAPPEEQSVTEAVMISISCYDVLSYENQ